MLPPYTDPGPLRLVWGVAVGILAGALLLPLPPRVLHADPLHHLPRLYGQAVGLHPGAHAWHPLPAPGQARALSTRPLTPGHPVPWGLLHPLRGEVPGAPARGQMEPFPLGLEDLSPAGPLLSLPRQRLEQPNGSGGDLVLLPLYIGERGPFHFMVTPISLYHAYNTLRGDVGAQGVRRADCRAFLPSYALLTSTPSPYHVGFRWMLQVWNKMVA